MTAYRTALNPDRDLVVREIEPGGDRAAWRTTDGLGSSGFAVSYGHKGPWLRVDWLDIPEPVRALFRKGLKQ